MERRFRDRADAGRALAERLRGYAGRDDVVVLALPRGGVPVAFEVARALEAPLDVFLVRKLGVPGHEELAMGAIASGGARVLNEDVVRGIGIGDEGVDAVATRELRELERREQAYRGGRPPLDAAGKVAILVDDGLATGASMRVALQALRRLDPERVVVGVPVAPERTCAALRQDVDEIVCLISPEPFLAVGAWYADFSETTDVDVQSLLERAAATPGAGRGSGYAPSSAARR